MLSLNTYWDYPTVFMAVFKRREFIVVCQVALISQVRVDWSFKTFISFNLDRCRWEDGIKTNLREIGRGTGQESVGGSWTDV